MNNNYNTNSEHMLEQCTRLLRHDAIEIPAQAYARMREHTALLRHWNRQVSLVSEGDCSQVESTHLPDALSLAHYVHRACMAGEGGLLDIGSGGGFPAIPLALLFPELPMTLIERSAKKVGFLRYVLTQLGLRQVKLLHGAFPTVSPQEKIAAITARAVEQPARLAVALRTFLVPGTTYLCQSGREADFSGELFHVEPVQDAWTAAGLRRGTLSLITRRHD
jgi:16S rRNA (guanine527-N7)-methyltransferase